MSDQTQSKSKPHWLDKRETPKRLWIGLFIILALLVVAELFVTHHHQGLMYTSAFSAWFGFLVALFSIVLSKGWKRMLKRKDTYYE